MFGEDHLETRPPKTREAAVHEWRVLVRVNQIRVVPARGARDLPAEPRPEPLRSTHCVDFAPSGLNPAGPQPRLLEADHHHRHLGVESGDELEHEPFRASGVEAEDDLKNAGRAHHTLSIARESCQERTACSNAFGPRMAAHAPIAAPARAAPMSQTTSDVPSSQPCRNATGTAIAAAIVRALRAARNSRKRPAKIWLATYPIGT